MINSLSFDPEYIKERYRRKFKSPQSVFSNCSKSKNMSVGKLCIKLVDFKCKNILNPETVSKVPHQCCCSIMDIQVPPIPNQPKIFRFSPLTFGVKKTEQSSFQLSWFDSRPWLHYDEGKDLAFCHLCMMAYRDGKLRSLNLGKAFIINGFSNWKDARVSLIKQESSKCHQEPMLKVEILPRTCRDIGEIHEIVSHKHAVYVKLAKFLAKITEILAPQNALKRTYRHR